MSGRGRYVRTLGLKTSLWRVSWKLGMSSFCDYNRLNLNKVLEDVCGKKFQMFREKRCQFPFPEKWKCFVRHVVKGGNVNVSQEMTTTALLHP